MASFRTKLLACASIAACATLAACSSGSDSTGPSSAGSSSSTTTQAPSASASATHAAWSYTGADGPEHWGDAAPTCADKSTSTQSPIDIDTAHLTPDPTDHPVEAAFTATTFKVFNNGHTIEAVPQSEGAAGGFTIAETHYEVKQFHFHDPSEHTLNGQNAPMEIHIVAKTDDDKTAVLGLLFQTGAENAALAPVFAAMPSEVTEEEEAVAIETPIDLSTLAPTGQALARYTGSLTTPPCTEGVLWDVYLAPGTISTEQLDTFKKLYPDNHRPVQQLNGREVVETTEVAGS